MKKHGWMRCAYCPQLLRGWEYVRHSIEAHDGLAGMRETHRQVCGDAGGIASDLGLDPATHCICRLAEYKAVAAAVAPAGGA